MARAGLVLFVGGFAEGFALSILAGEWAHIAWLGWRDPRFAADNIAIMHLFLPIVAGIASLSALAAARGFEDVLRSHRRLAPIAGLGAGVLTALLLFACEAFARSLDGLLPDGTMAVVFLVLPAVATSVTLRLALAFLDRPLRIGRPLRPRS